MKGYEQNERLTMTVEDVRNALGIGRNTAYELMHRPDFPSFNVGKSCWFPVPNFMNGWNTQTKPARKISWITSR